MTAVQVSQDAGRLDLTLPAVEGLLLDARVKRLSEVTSHLKTYLDNMRRALTTCADQLRAQAAGPAVPGSNAGWRIATTVLHNAAAKLRQHAKSLQSCVPTALYSSEARDAMARAVRGLDAILPQLAARSAHVTAEHLAADADSLREHLKGLPLAFEELLGASDRNLIDKLLSNARVVSRVSIPYMTSLALCREPASLRRICTFVARVWQSGSDICHPMFMHCLKYVCWALG